LNLLPTLNQKGRGCVLPNHTAPWSITHEPLAKLPKAASFLAIRGQNLRVCLVHFW
jgi:hypothetical protein